MASGVRNLRAMFENKDQSTSPPTDRGRSPASTGIGSNGTSPRPLSTIRTSFVTVEKSGQMGLQLRRPESSEPSVSKRRPSFGIEEDSRQGLERKESNTSQYSKRKGDAVLEDSIPEAETPKTAEEKTIPERPKEVVKNVESKAGPKKAEGTKIASNVPRSTGSSSGAAKPTAPKEEQPAAVKTASRPAPITTARTPVASKKSPIKSSAVPRTPTTPRGRGRPEEAVSTSEKKPDKRIARASPVPSQTSKSSSRPPANASHTSASRTRIQPSPPQTGFVKPKPRSPTRPVKLPASLMAHTASSGSKTANASPPSRQSLSRASGNAQPTGNLQSGHGLTRSPSRVSTTSGAKLARKPSTLNKSTSRPSLGPPPAALKKQPSRQSLPKSAPADESFLNRMMRPTTSSASKTAAATPPPQRAQSVKRPTVKEATPKSREAPKLPHVVAKPVAKVASAISKPIAKVASSVSRPNVKEPETKSESVPQAIITEDKSSQEESKPLEKPESIISPEAKSDFESPQASGTAEVESAPNVDTTEEPSQTRENEELSKPIHGLPVNGDDVFTDNAHAPPASSPKIIEPLEPPPSKTEASTHVQEMVEVAEPASPEITKASEVKTSEQEQNEALDLTSIIAKPDVEESVKSDVEESSKPEADGSGQPDLTPSAQPAETQPEAKADVKTPETETETKPEILEDEEDRKAREEVARLNAEFLKISAGDVGESY